MKYYFQLLILIVLPFQSSFSQGIEFVKGGLTEAMELAKLEGKLVFVDAYTTWCGPCKRMAKNVFTHTDVGAFYNANFVNLKLDMERGEGMQFQRKYRVTAFPTLLFIDASGKLVHRKVGGLDVANFLKLGEYAASKNDASLVLEADFEMKKNDPEYMASYIEARANAGRPVIKLTNDYLRNKPDFGDENNLKIIFYGATESDSRIFTTMVGYQKQIRAIVGDEKMNVQVEKACKATIEKAIKFKNPDLVEEAIDKYKKYAIHPSKKFDIEARLTYYSAIQDFDNYLKYARQYAKMGVAEKFELANLIVMKYPKNPELVQWAEIWASQAAAKEENEPNCFIAAKLQHMQGKLDPALENAEKALQMAKSNSSKAIPYIEKLIEDIKNDQGL